MTDKDKILKYLKYKGISKNKFYQKTGFAVGFLDSGNSLGVDKLKTVVDNYHDLNLKWFFDEDESMIKSVEEKGNLIPFWDDVTSMGGLNGVAADTTGRISPRDWINTGDWFGDATAAIRHQGDSMTEYPSGCILALREIRDINLIVWGKNYVIETDEFRITKRLQRGTTVEYIRAYSSNEAMYKDETLIHEPVDIPVQSIRRLWLVLGYVVNEQSTGIIYNVNPS